MNNEEKYRQALLRACSAIHETINKGCHIFANCNYCPLEQTNIPCGIEHITVEQLMKHYLNDFCGGEGND